MSVNNVGVQPQVRKPVRTEPSPVANILGTAALTGATGFGIGFFANGEDSFVNTVVDKNLKNKGNKIIEKLSKHKDKIKAELEKTGITEDIKKTKEAQLAKIEKTIKRIEKSYPKTYRQAAEKSEVAKKTIEKYTEHGKELFEKLKNSETAAEVKSALKKLNGSAKLASGLRLAKWGAIGGATGSIVLLLGSKIFGRKEA